MKAKRACQTEWPCLFIGHNNNYSLQRELQNRTGGISKNARYSKKKKKAQNRRVQNNKMRATQFKQSRGKRKRSSYRYKK